MFRSAVEDKMLQGQVDGRGNETGAKNKTADLKLKARLAPGIAIHDDTANVSCHFEKGADAERGGVRPGPGNETDDDGCEKTSSEEGAEKGVDAQHWGVAIKGSVDGAFWGNVETLSEIAFWSVIGGFHKERLHGDDKAGQQSRPDGGAHPGPCRRRWTIRGR